MKYYLILGKKKDRFQGLLFNKVQGGIKIMPPCPYLFLNHRSISFLMDLTM